MLGGCLDAPVDDDLILSAEREKHLRIKAGIPDGAPVDLSLIRRPDDALMFPNPPAPGEGFSFAQLRMPGNITKEFARKASKLGFRSRLRLHDLSGTHETLLLDAGVPVHVVAARCGTIRRRSCAVTRSGRLTPARPP